MGAVKEAAASFADMVNAWANDEEMPGKFTVHEGRVLRDMMHALGYPGDGDDLLYNVWSDEAESDRDPYPWANAHGSRVSDEDFQANVSDYLANCGDERFYFEPRPNADEWVEG
ncbi:hypothetical protein ACFWGP_05455 [Agromyces sp. NPDC127015]|uniref:hypothetical protein n=1 Tax=Agromyces sp. NPDC127015 TaxID=3347108 RepID=UPI003667150F